MNIETTCRPEERGKQGRGGHRVVPHMERRKEESQFAVVTRVSGDDGCRASKRHEGWGGGWSEGQEEEKGEITSVTAPTVPRIYDSFGRALRMITHAY